jgi:6,7-dimethyl-8-ribityllumazine synthase
LVVSRFNGDVTDRLRQACVDTLRTHGVSPSAVRVLWVPGAFELPWAARRLARSGRWDAVVALGCVIRGQTPHDRYVAGEAARGLAQVALETGVPVVFGVLTTLNARQARARSGSAQGNKGAEAARAALELANLARDASWG